MSGVAARVMGMLFVAIACHRISMPRAAAEGQPAQTKPPFVITKGSETVAAVNLPEKNLKLEGALFLPTSARRLRAIFVVMKHGETEALLLTGQNPYSVWHATAESLSCGLLHLRLSPIQAPEPGPTPPETDPKRNAAAGGGDGLLILMRQFARESGRADLADVPFLFWGWSSAAGFGPSFAGLHPGRTLAFVRYHSHMRGLPLDMETARHVPALIFVGGQDDPAIAEDSIALFNRGRSVAAPWALVVQPGVPHQIGAADIEGASLLTMSWISAVVNARVREGRGLVPMSAESGWLGDPETRSIVLARGAGPTQRHRSWLPDERTASAWQSLVAAPK